MVREKVRVRVRVRVKIMVSVSALLEVLVHCVDLSV